MQRNFANFILFTFRKVVYSQEIIEIVATRCHILKLKCTKFDFGWGSAQDRAGELIALPRPPSWI